MTRARDNVAAENQPTKPIGFTMMSCCRVTIVKHKARQKARCARQTGNASIKITRVEYVSRTENQTIKFSVKEEKTNTLNQGQSKVKQAGVNGEKIVTYEDKYVDGKLAESTLKNTQITKQPVEQIKLVGTKKTAVSSG